MFSTLKSIATGTFLFAQPVADTNELTCVGHGGNADYAAVPPCLSG